MYCNKIILLLLMLSISICAETSIVGKHSCRIHNHIPPSYNSKWFVDTLTVEANKNAANTYQNAPFTASFGKHLEGILFYLKDLGPGTSQSGEKIIQRYGVVGYTEKGTFYKRQKGKHKRSGEIIVRKSKTSGKIEMWQEPRQSHQQLKLSSAYYFEFDKSGTTNSPVYLNPDIFGETKTQRSLSVFNAKLVSIVSLEMSFNTPDILDPSVFLDKKPVDKEKTVPIALLEAKFKIHENFNVDGTSFLKEIKANIKEHGLDPHLFPKNTSAEMISSIEKKIKTDIALDLLENKIFIEAILTLGQKQIDILKGDLEKTEQIERLKESKLNIWNNPK